MIVSFKDKDTQKLFEGNDVKKFRSFRRAAERKLLILESALNLNDMRVPPGNHLEALSGNRKGQHSIRINRQWRICFEWTDEGPSNVEIVDYH